VFVTTPPDIMRGDEDVTYNQHPALMVSASCHRSRRRLIIPERQKMAAFSFCSSDDESGEEQMREFLSAGQVDQMVRHAIQSCWMALPKEKRSTDELKRQLNRMIDRAIQDMEEDRREFGM
jgi:hypothetical protein